MIIRGETPADFAAVHELVTEAFQRPDEAVLVDRLHANGQLAQAEGFGEVVIRADREPRHLVRFLGPCGEHEDRGPTVALDLLADLEPIHAR